MGGAGFWRWQPYGVGSRLRKRIWVADFVKGPDGLPLITPPKVDDVR